MRTVCSTLAISAWITAWLVTSMLSSGCSSRSVEGEQGGGGRPSTSFRASTETTVHQDGHGGSAAGGTAASGASTTRRGSNSATSESVTSSGGNFGGSVSASKGGTTVGNGGRSLYGTVQVGGANTGGVNNAGTTKGNGAGGSSTYGGTDSTNPVGIGGRDTTPVSELPVIAEMPDPLTMNDGTKVTTVEQWKIRRQQMRKILEDFEYGHMPPAPGNVKASSVSALQRVTVSGSLQADYRMLHLTFGPGEKLGFDLGIFMPVTASEGGEKPAILIMLTYAANKSSLADASAALSRGYAVATVPYQQLGADAANYASTAFFPSYPEYDWRDISAWAWGLSRAVDYLVTDDAVDPEKILISGVSRLGQAVLVAGAFDERIALSAPVAGGMAFRYSGKEMGGGLGQGITEIVDQNTYWFGPRFPEFRNKTTRLPCDQHWLLALTAPRLFILCNSLDDPYGRAYAAAQTYVAAKPVYEFLEAADHLGVNFRPGGHGMTSEDWSAILDFADQYLMKQGGSRRFDVLPPASQMP